MILNFLKAERALNYVEITVKQKMDFLSYKFDFKNSSMTSTMILYINMLYTFKF